MASKQKLDLLSLSTIPLVMTLGNSMLIPVLPTIQQQLQISNFQVSLIITVYSVVAIFLIPIAGYLSDRFGRKAVIVPSLIIAGLGGAVAGFAAWKFENAFWLILAGRLLQGVGSAGAAPVVLPLVGDMFKKQEDVSNGLGIIETANTFGKVLSPIIGSALAIITWFAPFLAIPVFSLISLLLIIFFVHKPKEEESKAQQSFKSFLKKIKEIFQREGKWLIAIFAIGAIVMFVLFGVLFYLSTILEENYKMTGIIKGLVLAIPLVGLSIASFITGKKIGSNKVLSKWLTFGGLFALTGSLLAIAFFNQLVPMLALLMLGGIGIGMTLPCLDALITEGIEKGERGTITSIYSSMRFVGVAVGPPVVSLLMKYSDQAIFFSAAFIASLGVIYTLLAIKPEKEVKALRNA